MNRWLVQAKPARRQIETYAAFLSQARHHAALCNGPGVSMAWIMWGRWVVGWGRVCANERTNVGVGALFVRSHRSQGTGALHQPVCSFVRIARRHAGAASEPLFVRTRAEGGEEGCAEGPVEARVVGAGVEGRRVGSPYESFMMLRRIAACCFFSDSLSRTTACTRFAAAGSIAGFRMEQ